MNVLPEGKRAQILACLVEGMSMRSVCRITGVAKKTPERLLRAIGKACREYHDANVKNLASQRVQCDEIWGYVACKSRNVRPDYSGEHRGSAWTWIGLDADTKLCISWHVGGRDIGAATVFMKDLRSRITNRVQLSTDGFRSYLQATHAAFGWDVDYSMLQKIYGPDHNASGPEKRYSPGVVVGTERVHICGKADPEHISTSFAERQNLTLRMNCRRFTRLTNAFSKKLEMHQHALALHFMHYNFVRVHQTLKMTPAMAAGLSDHPWSMLEIAALLQ